MSLIRELHHRLREAFRRELRREDSLVRDDDGERPATGDEPASGTEMLDAPLGVPAESPGGEPELPGFPHDDPSRG